MRLAPPVSVGNAWAGTPARLRGAVLTVAAVLILLLAVPALWPHSAPRGQILNGAEFGAVNGLLALGLVLTYRASRVINFSYGAMGALAATVAVECNLAHHVNWFVCIGIALLVGAALGLLVDAIIRWRFFTAPRLIVMVVTIGLAQLFGGIQLLVPGWLGGPSIVGGVTTPLSSHHVLIFPVLFNGNDLLIAIAVPVVLVALGWFLLRTDAGIAVRSVADNADRARLLGIPVRRLSTLVWVIAGVLAGLTGILSAPSAGITISAGAGPALILPALAAAIIAGMENLPLAFGASVGLGITSGLFEFNMPRYGSAIGDVVNLVAILLGLLFLQRKRSRADDAEETFSATGILKPIPDALRKLPEVVAARVGVMALVGLVIVVIPLVAGPGTTLEYTAALIYGIIAISLVVLTGWSGNVSLGQFAFAGVGGVMAGNLIEKANADFFLSLAAAGVAGAVLAVIVGIPALRIRGAYLAAVTLALGVAMDTFFLNPTYFPNIIPQAFLRPVLWQRFDLASNKSYYFLCLGFLVLTILFIQGLRRARPGRVLLATRDNEKAAAAMSVPPVRTKLAGFVLAGAVAGIAGGLYAVLLGAVAFNTFDPSYGLVVFSMAVIGGLSSISGVLMGVALIEVLSYSFPSTSWCSRASACSSSSCSSRAGWPQVCRGPRPAAQGRRGPARHPGAEPGGRQARRAGRPCAGGDVVAGARAERGRGRRRRRRPAVLPGLRARPRRPGRGHRPRPGRVDERRPTARARPRRSPSRARRWRSPTARCRSSSASTSRSTRARSWRCWAPTAPASRPAQGRERPRQGRGRLGPAAGRADRRRTGRVHRPPGPLPHAGWAGHLPDPDRRREPPPRHVDDPQGPRRRRRGTRTGPGPVPHPAPAGTPAGRQPLGRRAADALAGHGTHGHAEGPDDRRALARPGPDRRGPAARRREVAARGRARRSSWWSSRSTWRSSWPSGPSSSRRARSASAAARSTSSTAPTSCAPCSSREPARSRAPS